MKFEKILQEFSGNPFFELRELRSLAPESDSQLMNQLSQWVKQEKLVRLRKGKYLLSSTYRKFTPSTYYISNYLYRPSYVSLATALQFYDLIPEAVAPVQAITTRHGREWTNELGRFVYRKIKQERFWGYREEVLGKIPTQNRFLVARPEKAILDLMYIQNGEWTKERIIEMRFQSLESLNFDRFQEYSERFNSPKIKRAARRFVELYAKELTL